jgi:hypothetical protein
LNRFTAGATLSTPAPDQRELRLDLVGEHREAGDERRRDLEDVAEPTAGGAAHA